MKALLIGATGATGKDLLELLLNDNSFRRVDIFVRRMVEVQHEKLVVHVIDFNQPAEWKNLVHGDVLFSCFGTTLQAAGSKETQWKIDYEYQYQFAKAAQENHVKNYILVSSAGASPKSLIFYAGMKGKLEDVIKKLGFSKITIFNPPLLERKNNNDRTGEQVTVKVIKFFNKIGILRSHKPLPTHILAKAMINSAKTSGTGLTVIKGAEIWKMAKSFL